MKPFKFGNKVITQESLDADLTAHLIPANTELDCLIDDAVIVPFETFKNGDTKDAHLKINFMVCEKGGYQRKTAKKDFYIEGKGAARGLQGIAMLDHICGGLLEKGDNDLNNARLLKNSFIGKKVSVTFDIFIPNGGSVAYQTVKDFSTPSSHDAEIMRQAETAQPTATFYESATTFNPDMDVADEFEDDEPF